MEIHWRAPIQAKGFLKIIEMFIALLAFSLVAGFSVTHHVDCSSWLNDTSATAHIATAVKYPFSQAITKIRLTGLSNESLRDLDNSLPLVYKQASQFFVVWGIFSVFYGVIALSVYILLTANKALEWLVNYLIITDLIFHVVWVLCWLIASIEWAAAQVQMKNYISNIVQNNEVLHQNCFGITMNNNPGSYVQAAIADVFGFTSLFLWAINIYWVFIDTSFYLEWRGRREHTPLVD